MTKIEINITDKPFVTDEKAVHITLGIELNRHASFVDIIISMLSGTTGNKWLTDAQNAVMAEMMTWKQKIKHIKDGNRHID